MVNHTDMRSTCSCHFGGFFGFFGRRIRRHSRIAAATRTTPIAIRTASAAVAGEVCGLGGGSWHGSDGDGHRCGFGVWPARIV